MISKQERKRLKKILGKEYSEAVSIELSKENAVNKHGQPYTSSHIRIIFNGVRNSPVIESAIYKAAETAIATNLLEKAKREKILKSI